MKSKNLFWWSHPSLAFVFCLYLTAASLSSLFRGRHKIILRKGNLWWVILEPAIVCFFLKIWVTWLLCRSKNFSTRNHKYCFQKEASNGRSLLITWQAYCKTCLFASLFFIWLSTEFKNNSTTKRLLCDRSKQVPNSVTRLWTSLIETNKNIPFTFPDWAKASLICVSHASPPKHCSSQWDGFSNSGSAVNPESNG